MSERPDIAALHGVRFVAGLPDRDLEKIAGIGQVATYPFGATVFREGDAADAAFLLVRGKAAVELCAPAVGCRRVLTVGPGDLLGWSAMLGQPAVTATAHALEPITTIALNAGKLQQLLNDDAPLGLELMRRTALTLAQRLRTARLQATDVYNGGANGGLREGGHGA